MLGRAASVVGLAVAAGWPAAAHAEPVAGSDRGVRLAVGPDHASFVFAPASARRYAGVAGRLVVVACVTTRMGLTGPTVASDVLYVRRAPARRGRLRVPASVVAGADFCSVHRRGSSDTDLEAEVAVVSRTAAGRSYQEERRLAFGMQAVLERAGSLAATRSSLRWPAPSELVAVARRTTVVALDGPDATAPAGRVGYWSEGGSRVVITGTTSAGRRLVLGYDRDVLQSNVIGYLSLG